jgi:hypothetical protein
MPLMSDAAKTASTEPTTATTSTTPTTTTTETTPRTPAPPPPKPPIVSTGYAPEVTQTTATVKGGVMPRGVETSYLFQYGASAAYGLQTAATPVGAGTQEVKVVQGLAGLTPNTAYHYRLVAVSGAGTTFGQDRSFTTKKVPLKIVIATAPNPTLFGARFLVRGSVSGSDAANQWIVLQANPFPYRLAGFSNVGVAEQTDAAGNFTMPVGTLPENSRLRVTAANQPNVSSPAVVELVEVRVSFHARHSARPGYVRLYGSVSPAAAGAHVSFQWIRHGHPPVRIGGTKVRAGSAFARTVRLHHHGRYRAFVQVKGGRLLSHYSRSISIG